MSDGNSYDNDLRYRQSFRDFMRKYEAGIDYSKQLRILKDEIDRVEMELWNAEREVVLAPTNQSNKEKSL